jgi:hypothetical protein
VAHSVALFYNAQAGRPYSLLFGSDINTDGFATNDLLFVPGAADAIILKDSAGAVIPYARLADFLRSAGIDATAGRILNRNESREPWSHIWDFHYGVELPVRAVRTSLALDILNLLNLFDKDRGNVRYVNNQTYTPVRYVGLDSATGKPIYQAVSPTALNPGNQFLLADLRSRWQAKLSLRFSF